MIDEVKQNAVLGERLLAARKRAGWSRRVLAEATGLPQRSIQAYEQGKMGPPAVRLRVLADALGVPLDELLPPGK